MAQNKYALARYCLIHKALQKNDFVKTSYLVDLCKKRLGYSVSRRTIQIDIVTMRDDTFLSYHAPIKYCKKRKAYYYDSEYELMGINFSKQEIDLLSYISDFIKNEIEKTKHQEFSNLVKKIKIISAC